MLPMFEKCIAGLMHVDVYFSASETHPVCHFNQFRSRQKYQEFCNRLLERVWEELNARNLQEFERRYLEIQLEEMGKLFVLEDGKVVAHRNVLVFCDKSAVELGELNAQCRCLLSAYLNIQYLAWCGLCRLCREFAPLVQGNYAWQGDAIALLVLFDALWCLRWVKPVQGDRSKKCYFQHLQAFFHLPVLDDPCRRLGDLGKRAEPHGFVVKLSDDYQRYWEEREG